MQPCPLDGRFCLVSFVLPKIDFSSGSTVHFVAFNPTFAIGLLLAVIPDCFFEWVGEILICWHGGECELGTAHHLFFPTPIRPKMSVYVELNQGATLLRKLSRINTG